MKYLNGVLTAIAILLFFILVKLSFIDTAVQHSNKALITSNEQLQNSIDEFRKLLEPVVKRYFRK